jgi:hypothetical protein
VLAVARHHVPPGERREQLEHPLPHHAHAVDRALPAPGHDQHLGRPGRLALAQPRLGALHRLGARRQVGAQVERVLRGVDELVERLAQLVEADGLPGAAGHVAAGAGGGRRDRPT